MSPAGPASSRVAPPAMARDSRTASTARAALLEAAVRVDVVLDPFRRRLSPLAASHTSPSASHRTILTRIRMLAGAAGSFGWQVPAFTAALARVFTLGQTRWATTAIPEPAERALALTTMDTLCGPLLRAMTEAARAGEHELVWQLAETTVGVCARRGRVDDWARVAELGARAALACGHHTAQAHLLAEQAAAVLRQSTQARYTRAAHTHARAALTAARRAGDERARTAALDMLARTAWRAGHHRMAWQRLNQALVLDQRLGDLHGLARHTMLAGTFSRLAGNAVGAALLLYLPELIFGALDDLEAGAHAGLALSAAAACLPPEEASSLGSLHRTEAAVAWLRQLGSPHGTAHALAWSSVNAYQAEKAHHRAAQAVELTRRGSLDRVEVLTILEHPGPRSRTNLGRPGRERLRGAGVRPPTPGRRLRRGHILPRPGGELAAVLAAIGTPAEEHLARPVLVSVPESWRRA